MNMPVLFVGHGNPMNTLSVNEFTDEWKALGRELPKPKAILCISAHWECKATYLTGMVHPETIHDFGGFPQQLYDVEYPAYGSPELASDIKKMVIKYNIEPTDKWGLDHGCWSILRHFYPDADIPVIEMSIDYNKSFRQHYDLGKELSELRKKSILIIGSGNIVHNLSRVDWKHENASHDWAVRFNDNIKELINKNDIGSILDIKSNDKDYHLAVPTPEHFIPLIYALALKEDKDKVTFFNDKIVMGSLSMTSFKMLNA
jgi:4,5-DOPA dioxygenase extradiol